MRPFVSTIAAAVLALAAFGCSASVSASSEQADAEAGPTAAVVVVARTSDGARGEAVARFMRLRSRADQAEALRLVGAAVDLPSLGSCFSLTSAAPATTPSVQLLDVGAVTMETNGVQTPLFARQVPDVVDLVSGVVYARAADAELLPARAGYVLHVAGGADGEGFVVSANAPADLAELRVAGQDGRSVALLPGGGADLAWEPGAAEDAVYVDVNAADVAGGVRMPTVRCAFGDVGHASIAAAFLPDEGTLTVHRVHREHFRTSGIDAGELRFDFARVVGFARR